MARRAETQQALKAPGRSSSTRYQFMLFGAVLLLVSMGLVAFAASRQDFSSSLDALIPQLLSRHDIPGAAVALVCNGEVVWSRGYGYADLSRRRAVTDHTVFQVASLSKTVTAWGVMRLVEKGLLELDAPAERYLTRWHLPASRFDEDQVTIRRLLSHTAGLSLRGYPGFEPNRRLPSLEESLSGNTGGSGDVHIVQRPGSEYSYSGGGYTLLQLVIEEVTGQVFSDFMVDEILSPLDMHESAFEWTGSVKTATAVAYNSAMRPLPNYLFTAKAAAGLYSTARDYARFLAACLAGPDGETPGRGVLSSDGVDLLTAPHQETDGQYGLGYGIGWLSTTSWYVRHSGGNNGWKSLFALVPSYRAGIVILFNSNNGDEVRYDVLDAWLEWIKAERECDT